MSLTSDPRIANLPVVPPDAGGEDTLTTQRHPLLERLEVDLQRVTWDLCVSELAARSGHQALVLLPTVVWLAGPADHPKSGRGLLPYPITWPTGPAVQVAAGAMLTLEWVAQAWGHRTVGSVRIHANAFDPTVNPSGPTTVHADDLLMSGGPRLGGSHLEVVATAHSADEGQRMALDVNRAGDDARWRVHELLQPWLRRSLDDSHRAVSAELRVPRVLDKLAMDELFDVIHLGGEGKSGLVDKVIHRLADPNQRRLKVDPARYIVTTFRRDTELALRRKIDDPRWLGPALRRFAECNVGLDVEELVKRFNASGCNSERIGVARALRALEPAVQPHTSYVSMDLMASQQELDPADILMMPIRQTKAARPTPLARRSA